MKSVIKNSVRWFQLTSTVATVVIRSQDAIFCFTGEPTSAICGLQDGLHYTATPWWPGLRASTIPVTESAKGDGTVAEGHSMTDRLVIGDLEVREFIEQAHDRV